MTIFMVMCAIGCYACILTAALYYDMKAAALMVLAVLFEAFISAVLVRRAEEEYSVEYKELAEECNELLTKYNELKEDFNDLFTEYKDLRRDFMEDDGK